VLARASAFSNRSGKLRRKPFAEPAADGVISIFFGSC
jgi:hypothetical protein